MYPTIIQNFQCKRECLHKKALQKSRNQQSVDTHFPSSIPTRKILIFPVYEVN